jgi:hypothetical protein
MVGCGSRRLLVYALCFPLPTSNHSLAVSHLQVDDVLPPAAIARWASGATESSNLAALKARCDLHLAARHSAERLLRCWGSGAGQSHAETKERIAKVCVLIGHSAVLGQVGYCLHLCRQGGLQPDLPE